MNNRFLEVYALSVCFVSISCLSIFCGIFLYSLVEISFPSTINSSRLHYPPVFSQSDIMTAPIFPDQPLPVQPLPETASSEAMESNAKINWQLQEDQKLFEKLETERLKEESIMSIVRSIIVILIASIIFNFHWRIAKQARSGNDT
ncbi:MAG: hypothetical protein Q9M20_01195 [Mariprofundaceae bacterium]|nr:hypothetical protein [Mariprofundaceae bacterium]